MVVKGGRWTHVKFLKIVNRELSETLPSNSVIAIFPAALN